MQTLRYFPLSLQHRNNTLTEAGRSPISIFGSAFTLVATWLALAVATALPSHAQQIELAPAQLQPNLCRDVNGNVQIEHPESVTASWPPARYNNRDYEMVLVVCRGRKDQCFTNTSGNDPQSWQANPQFWKAEPIKCKQGTGIQCKWPPPSEASAAFQPEKPEPATIYMKAHIFQGGTRVTRAQDSRLLIIHWDWPKGKDGKPDTGHKCPVQPPTDYYDAKLAWDGDGHVDVNPGHLHIQPDEQMSWTFEGRATNGANVTCSGHLTAPFSAQGMVPGQMKCDLDHPQEQTHWHCEGPAWENPGWQGARSGGAFFATGYAGNGFCTGTSTRRGKTQRLVSGLLWVSKS